MAKLFVGEIELTRGRQPFLPYKRFCALNLPGKISILLRKVCEIKFHLFSQDFRVLLNFLRQILGTILLKM